MRIILFAIAVILVGLTVACTEGGGGGTGILIAVGGLVIAAFGLFAKDE